MTIRALLATYVEAGPRPGLLAPDPRGFPLDQEPPPLWTPPATNTAIISLSFGQDQFAVLYEHPVPRVRDDQQWVLQT